MGVFVRVEMRNLNTGRLKFFYLGSDFSFDVFQIKPTAGRAQRKVGETIAKSRVYEKRRYVFCITRRHPIYQHDMTSDAQARSLRHHTRSLSEFLAAGH